MGLFSAVKNWRSRLVGDLDGDVLEIGVGTGENLSHYRRASGIWGVEPDKERAAQAELARQSFTAQHGIPIQIHVAPAEALPFAEDRFDNIVSSLVFCSVNNQRKALSEIARVLRPGGTLWMVEHVRPQTPPLGLVAGWVTPGWRKVAFNCHLDRPTLSVLAKEGWSVTVHRRIGVFVKLSARKMDQ